MKTKLLLLVAAALLVSGTAFADQSTETLSFQGGLVVGTSGGFTLTGATLTGETNDLLGNVSGSNLGNVTFTTGVMGSPGNVGFGAYILPGGTVTITGNGSNPGVNGTLFTGTFAQGANWTMALNNGTYQYTLEGVVTGVTGTNQSASGDFVLSVFTGTNQFQGAFGGPNASGSATLAVPEPAELTLMGTGLLGLLGAIRRKLKA